MPERTGSGGADERQMKLDRLRRLYALHDPTASEEQIDTWIEESVDANDYHEDPYEDQVERVEKQIHIEQGDVRNADIHRIKENGELFANISDLVDNLTLDRAGRVRYAMGAIAMEGNVGGRFTPRRWLEIIDAHADEIREGIEHRNEDGISDAEREDRAAEANENKPFTVTDKRYSHFIEDDKETSSAPRNPEAPETSAPGESADMPLVISFIDQTHDALAAARDAAEARRRNEVQHGARWHRFLKNIWMGENGLAGAYYLEKYKKEALADIEQANDIYTHESDDTNANKQAQLATIERFQSEYDESIHEDAGEKRTELADDSSFGIKMKELVARYVSGEITDPEALTEERGRILEELGTTELIGEGKVRIDNMVAIAEQVKAMVDHGQSIDNVLEGMKIYSAEARSNVRSEAHLGKIERTIDRLQKSKLGGLVSPETIGATAAIALGVARAGRGTLLRAAGVTLVPGVLGGAFAAMRESKRLKEERAIHAREMAQGKEYEGGKRRDQMEATRYETIAAQEITAQLELTLHSNNQEPLTPESVQEAYEFIAGIEARIRLSDMRNIDLVSYSSVTSVERERQQLDEARALAKQRLGKHMTELPFDFKQRFTIIEGQPVNDALQHYTEATVGIATDMSTKDQAYRKLRRRRVATAAATGAATSLFVGLGTQEIVAAIDPTYDGLIEHAIQGAAPSGDGRQTVLEGMVHGQSSSTTVERFVPSSTYDSHKINSNGATIEVPSGYTLITNEDGTFTMQAPAGGESINGISVDKNGSLSEASRAVLAEHNVEVADKGVVIETEATSAKSFNVAEYNELNKKDTTHIKRDFWYDNNTTKFDKNELSLDWSGGDGVTPNGAFQMNVSGMTEGGSYHNLDKTSWTQTAKEGELKLAISGSRDTQSQVYMIDVQPGGTIDIPRDSPAAQFFSTVNGHAEFNGAYAEVVDIRGETGNTTHVAPLATVVGDGSAKEFTQTVTTTTKEYVPKLTLTPPESQVMTHTPGRIVEGFGMPGIAPRKGIERLKDHHAIRQPEGDPFNYAYGGGRSLNDMRRWVQQNPERMHTRRMINKDGERQWVEADGSPVERSAYRERTVINRYLESEYQKNPTYRSILNNVANELNPMDENCRVSVNIPAWMEGKTLNHLLSEYIDQRDNNGNPIDPRLYEINIIVNRKEGTKSDDSIAVIENFMTQYATSHDGRRPNIHYVDVELKPENATVGYARKLLTDATLLRSIERPQQTQPLYIESEDADLISVDKRVVTNLISKLDKNPHLDAVHGIEGRLPALMKDNDLLVMRRNAWENFLLQARQKKYRDPTAPTWNSFANRTITGGWNTGYSAEAYALIDGYEPLKSGEDISIGERISMMRGDGQYPNLETIGSVPTRIESSPRRFINEIIRNKFAYEGFGEGADEAYIREKDPAELMDEIKEYSRITESNRPIFEAEASMFYDWCKSATPDTIEAKEMAKRVLLAVGYQPNDYEFTKDKVVIRNWSNVTANLAAYRSQFDRAQRPSRKMVINGWKRPDLRTTPKT